MGVIEFTKSFFDTFVIGPLTRVAGRFVGSGNTGIETGGADTGPAFRDHFAEPRHERGSGRARQPSNRIGWWRGNRAG